MFVFKTQYAYFNSNLLIDIVSFALLNPKCFFGEKEVGEIVLGHQVMYPRSHTEALLTLALSRKMGLCV